MIASLAILWALAAPEPAPEWEMAIAPRPFRFPRDHAAHEDYRIEWWYYTGNLRADDGRQFGYQVTFFRTGVVRQPKIPSPWAVRDLYVAHFALSDLAQQQFRFFERVKRAGVGGAGAAADLYHVWNGPWEVRLEGDEHRLGARDEGHELQLRLKPLKPPVLHGAGGLSQKGASRGNASYYYSLTRLETRGTLTLGARRFAVTGLSWMDHEFSSSFLEKGQVGWDWLSIQLDDRRELMIYQIRHDDGRTDPFSSGTLVAADGRAAAIDRNGFTLAPGRRWTSPQTGAAYPVQWRLRVPAHGLDLRIEASLENQEMDTRHSVGFPYWEGSIQVEGTAGAAPVGGCGYLEMTGYARNLPTR